MNVRQSAANELSNEQVQVLLTGKFGDGALATNSKAKFYPNFNFNYYYCTNCIHKEYIEYKKKLLGSLCTSPIKESINKGFKANIIYKINSICSKAITEIACESLEKSLNRMDELGLALWFFDDGSLHKNKNFYNLNTQRYSEDINRNLIAPFLKDKFNIIAKPTIERKKDGREFWYLRIGKFDGAFKISEILKASNINCFNYKLISSETIQKWSKLQEELKSTDIDVNSLTHQKLSRLLKETSI